MQQHRFRKMVAFDSKFKLFPGEHEAFQGRRTGVPQLSSLVNHSLLDFQSERQTSL